MPSTSLRPGAILVAVLLGLGCKSESTSPESTVALIEVTPRTALMYSVGDSTKFTAALTTAAGTAGEDIEIGWTVRDKTLLSVNSAGIAKALKKGGSTYVIATAGGKSDSAKVEVPVNPCGTVAPISLALGQVFTDIGVAGFCIADVIGAEYTVLAFNSSLTSSSTTSIEVSAQGVGNPPTTNKAPLPSLNMFARQTGLVNSSRVRDVAAEEEFRKSERATLTPLVAGAQSWFANRSPSALRAAAAPPAVGDIMPVNVNLGLTCTTASITMRNARVAAVSASAIVLDDPNNPTPGFTDAEYNNFAVTFDTLVNPLDTQNFGVPTDLDGNARVIILFTRAVNELTSPGAPNGFISGRTMSRDLFPKTTSGGKDGCLASNVGEIFYMFVPDPTGTINGNQFDKDFVTSQTVATIAHEYQHMINISRRMYQDAAGLFTGPPRFTADKWNDETWLQEGLSHMAEELVFHRVSGLATRTNIGLSNLITTQAIANSFGDFMFSNFLLYDSYAFFTPSASPYRQVDGGATRGATWSFLRYAADQLGAADGDLWYRLVNSGLLGQTNLQAQLGITSSGLQTMIRDFTIAVYGDDHVNGLAPKYTQPSWNMRSIYPGLCDPTDPCSYPIVLNGLPQGGMVTSTLVAGGFAVYRVRPIGGTDAFVRATGVSATPLPTAITLTVIRTK